MPINEGIVRRDEGASYIKPNAGKSYKLQRVRKSLSPSRHPPIRNAVSRTPSHLWRMDMPYHCECSRRWSPMERPCPKPWRNLPPVARQWPRQYPRFCPPYYPKSYPKYPSRKARRAAKRRCFRQCQHGTSLSHAAWHDPVFPRWRLDHRRHQPVHAGLRAYGRTSATPCDLSRVPAGS